MGKIKKVAELIDENFIDGDNEKEPNALNFFSEFKTCEKDYVISLYKKEAKGTRVLLRQFENDTPSAGDIQNTYGGGRYELYANEYIDGKSKLLASTTLNLADLPKNETQTAGISKQDDFFNTDNLQKLAMIKQIFGGGESQNAGLSDMMIKLAEMQNSANIKMMEIQREADKRSTEMMNRFNDKMMELISAKTEKQSGFGEMKEIISFVREIDGGGSAEKTAIDKLIDYAPMLMQGIGGQLNNNQATPAQPVIPVQQYAKPPKSREQEIDEIIKKLPKEMIEKVNEENKEKIIDYFYNTNKDIVTRQDVIDIVEEILKRKKV